MPYRTYVFSHVCHIALEAWHRAHKLGQRLEHATQKLPCQSLFCSLNMRISMKLVTRLACRVITLFSLFPWKVTNIPFGYKEAFAFDYWALPSACDTPISFYRSRRFSSTYYEYSSLKWPIAITVPEWIKKSLTELTPKFYKAYIYAIFKHIYKLCNRTTELIITASKQSFKRSVSIILFTE